MSGADVIDAGPFDQWLTVMRAVLRGARDAEVPCGDCVGCCVSAYPIPLRPADRVALDMVPAQHLRLSADGSKLARMGFRDDGSCPMLCAGKCSIYSDRPQTCRDYDCRIYAAAGLLPDGDRPVIKQRVLAWRFKVGTDKDRIAADAVQRAAAFIKSHASLFPESMRTNSATAIAVLAVKVSALFEDISASPGMHEPAPQAAKRVADAARAFDNA
jgi:uncharacterized protein